MRRPSSLRRRAVTVRAVIDGGGGESSSGKDGDDGDDEEDKEGEV
jgi:hypothetical protein